jgi:hypothetical protein
MNTTYNASFTFALLAFGLLSIVQINFDQLSYATICFDCPDTNFHLDEAKKSIDNGDYSGAKNHIDQAKELIGQHNSHSITNGLKPTNATNVAPQ